MYAYVVISFVVYLLHMYCVVIYARKYNLVCDTILLCIYLYIYSIAYRPDITIDVARR